MKLTKAPIHYKLSKKNRLLIKQNKTLFTAHEEVPNKENNIKPSKLSCFKIATLFRQNIGD
jgi:hypothetical protein